MSLKFFSQFLQIEKLVSQEHLDEAIAQAGVSHQTLGDLAQARGFLTDKQADAINKEQLKLDLPFGRLAQERGFLTEEQLQSLLNEQSEQHMKVGEALVNLGHVGRGDMDDILSRFAEAQSPNEAELKKILGTLSENRVANFLLSCFPKMTMRLSRLHVKVGREVSLDEGTGDYTATINLEGDDAVCMGLSTDKSFARTIMAGMTRIMSGDSEILYGEDKEDFEDLLGGFLDIIGGHAVGALEGERLELEMGTPEFGNLLSGGLAFELQSVAGKATLYLRSLEA
ncbi:MAG: hypothetical protein VX210_11870 [Myxococcota bacterium]|nr:hypothetical protein [Myxococcota bacterium]